MLRIHQNQMAALQAELFERWMASHLRRFFSTLCADRSESQLRSFIRAGVAKARDHGFSESADLSGFIDLMLVLDEDFDENPALPWAAGVLADPGPSPPAARLEALRHFAHEWLTTGSVRSSVFTVPELDAPEPLAPTTEPERAATAQGTTGADDNAGVADRETPEA